MSPTLFVILKVSKQNTFARKILFLSWVIFYFSMVSIVFLGDILVEETRFLLTLNRSHQRIFWIVWSIWLFVMGIQILWQNFKNKFFKILALTLILISLNQWLVWIKGVLKLGQSYDLLSVAHLWIQPLTVLVFAIWYEFLTNSSKWILNFLWGYPIYLMLVLLSFLLPMERNLDFQMHLINLIPALSSFVLGLGLLNGYIKGRMMFYNRWQKLIFAGVTFFLGVLGASTGFWLWSDQLWMLISRKTLFMPGHFHAITLGVLLPSLTIQEWRFVSNTARWPYLIIGLYFGSLLGFCLTMIGLGWLGAARRSLVDSLSNGQEILWFLFWFLSLTMVTVFSFGLLVMLKVRVKQILSGN